MSRLELGGLLPAVVTPFHEDLAIDEASLGALVRRVQAIPEAIGVVVSGIAGEIDTLSRAERDAVVRAAVAATPTGNVVIAGIEASTPQDGRAQAEAAAACGASAVLLQAPASFARGIADAPEVAIRYVREVARSGVPVILFQHQIATQRSYPLPLLLRLLEIDGVVAVKETIWDVARYEQNVRAIRRERPDAQVLLANDTLLLPCLVSAMPDGILVGFASIAGEEIGRLWSAVRANRLDDALQAHERLAPLRDAIYAAPGLDYYSRAKAALQLLGVLPNAKVRPPLVESPPDEVERVRSALVASGLL